MAKNSVSDWDTTASNNTDVGGINIAENCASANVNNAMREIMAQIAGDVVLNSGDEMTGPLVTPVGTPTAPAVSFTGTQTGWYYTTAGGAAATAGGIRFAVGGVASGEIVSAAAGLGPLTFLTRTAGDDRYVGQDGNQEVDGDFGITGYLSSDELQTEQVVSAPNLFANSSGQLFKTSFVPANKAGDTFTGPVTVPQGVPSAPGWNFVSTTTGAYYTTAGGAAGSAGGIRFSVGGTAVAEIVSAAAGLGSLTLLTRTAGDARYTRADASFGTVNTPAMLKYSGGTTIGAGDNVSGSLLKPSDASGNTVRATSVSGTWKCLGAAATNEVTLWLRVS